MVESRLEGLVFHHHALALGERGVGGFQSLFKPAAAMAYVLRAGVVGTIGEPEREIAAAQALLDFDAIQNVVHGLLANRRIGIAQGPVLIVLILKQVGIDGPRAQPILGGQGLNFHAIANALGQIPQDMQRDAGANARYAVHLAGIGELFRRGGGRGRLKEFAETGTGIGKAPRGQFDMKRVQRVDYLIGLFIGNHDLATRSTIICGLGVPGQTDPKCRSKFRQAEQRVRVVYGGSYGYGGI